MKVDITNWNIKGLIKYINMVFKPVKEAKELGAAFDYSFSAGEATLRADRRTVYAFLTNMGKNALRPRSEGALEFGYHWKAANGPANGPLNASENSDNDLKINILIAEDDEVSQILLEKTVQLFSKSIIKVGTGVNAVEACRAHPDIDLVLMDIQMPELNGYEATRQIRLFNKEVIIIAQTAYALSGDRKKSMDAGCNDHLSKPINTNELRALIQKYFKQ